MSKPDGVSNMCHHSLQRENSETRYLCLQNLRPGQMLGAVQPFSCLCIFSLSKLILHFIEDNFSCPSQKLKIMFPPSKAFFPPFYVNFFLPESKVANRGSTHILHAGDGLSVRADNRGACLRCGTGSSVKMLHQCNDI